MVNKTNKLYFNDDPYVINYQNLLGNLTYRCRFLYRPDSAEYRRFRDLVSSIKQENKGCQFLDINQSIKQEPEFEFKGDTDLRLEFANNSEYGSNLRGKTEPDSEYGSNRPCFSQNSSQDFKTEFVSDRGNGNCSKAEYGGFVKAEIMVSEFGKSEYGSGEKKSDYGFVKAEPEYGLKPEQPFVYGGNMAEQKAETKVVSEVKSEYGGQNYEFNEYGEDPQIKSEYGSGYGSDSNSAKHYSGGTKRDMSSGDEEDERERRERKRRSRWGPQSGNAPPVTVVAPQGVLNEF